MHTVTAPAKHPIEQRWCSEPIWWRSPIGEFYQQGWLLERSNQRAEFLSRGTGPPLPGTAILTSVADPDQRRPSTALAFVRRVDHVHGDLFLVAAEFEPETV